MPQSFSTSIGLSANATSAGQAIDFDGAVVRGLTLTNTSGASIQYTLTGASWVTVSTGTAAYLGAVEPSTFRMRKTASDSYPIALAASWTAYAANETVSDVDVSSYGPANPLFIAHRGGALVVPENTTEGFYAAYLAGERALEMDVCALSDGALGVMHDTTIDRTTTGTGAVSAQSTAQWQALAVDASTQNITGFGNALVPPLFSSLATEFARKVIFMPEVKVTGVKQSVVDALVAAGVPTNQAIVSSFTLADLAPAVAAGYSAMLATNTSTDIAAAQAAGITWVTISQATADSVFTDWIRAGFKVVAYTVNRRFRRDQLLALGVSGFFSDDPAYLRSSGAVAVRDTYALGKWMPGMFGEAEATSAAVRGVLSGGRWGWTDVGDVTFSRFVLQGWAGYLTQSSFSIRLTARINAVNGGDATRWFNVVLSDASAGDRGYTDNTATITEKGYTFLHRKNGNLVISRRDGGTTTSLISTTNATYAMTDGVDVFMKLTVTPTTLRWARVDAAGNELFAVTATDSTYRGGPMHLGKNGAIAEFSSVSIS